MNDSSNNPSNRPLLAIFLLLGVPLFGGMFLSPYVFHLLQWIGQHTDVLTELTDARFERVTSRVVMLIALFMLIPSIRMSGLAPAIRRAWFATPLRWTELRVGLIVGCLSIATAYLVGFLAGVYIVSPKLPSIGRLVLELVEFLLGVIFIAVFEETFFRGFIYGGLRRRLAFLPSLLLASVFFSFIHFLRPRFPEVTTDISWTGGFELLPHMFALFDGAEDWPFAITLFVMGLALAAFYEKRASFYLIAGLHGGWVFAIRTGSLVFDRDRAVESLLFGHSDLLSKAPLAIPIILLFLIAALLSKGRPSNNGKND